MQIELVILVRLDPEAQRRLLELGHLTMDQALQGQGFVERRFPAGSDEARELIERLEEDGVDYYVHEERQFSPKEIRAAKALHVEPRERVGRLSSTHTVEYDWSDCCPLCMRVPVQTGPLTVAAPELDDATVARGPRGEVIVNEQIATRMIKEEITGCLLREVQVQGEGPDSYFQLIPTRTLPSTISPPTKFLSSDDACPVCGRGGLYLDSMLYYDLPVREIEDFNVTSEYFGDGAGIRPEVVVSPRFYNLLVSCGAELERREPVLFV